jgi:hypothetical protein
MQAMNQRAVLLKDGRNTAKVFREKGKAKRGT